MAKNQTRRLPPSVLKQDRAVYAALKAIQNYAPANPTFARAQLDAEFAELDTAAEEFVQVKGLLAGKRDTLVGRQWSFHNKMLGVKNQVVAQFGPDSNEAQAVGLKKKTEYKPRARKPKANTAGK